MSTDKVKLSFDILAATSGTTITVRLDGDPVWQGDPAENLTFSVEIPETDGTHALEIELSGKLPEHTKLDDDGNICEDIVIDIKNVCFDEINIDQIFYEKSQYHHDFNGTKESTIDKFYGKMGCNGKVVLGFSSPVYIWLLENM